MDRIDILLTKEQTILLNENGYVIVGDYIIVTVDDNEYYILAKVVKESFSITENY